MRRIPALSLGAAALASLLLPTVSNAQYDGPPYGPGGPGPYGYGPGPGMGGPGMGGPGMGGPGMGGPGMGGPGMGGPDGYPGRRANWAPKPRAYVAYRGYKIGLSSSAKSHQGAREAAGIEHQVDIVNKAGLSARDLRLFRSKLIRSNSAVRAGRSDGDERVVIGRINYDDSRPVLLHEFMHVYHRNRLPGGFNNPAVLRFYEEAVASGAYPQGSYMLRNQKEFFAMTASAYLHGSVARPPYNRETIREAQPAYYAYLGQLFGPR